MHPFPAEFKIVPGGQVVTHFPECKNLGVAHERHVVAKSIQVTQLASHGLQVIALELSPKNPAGQVDTHTAGDTF